MTRPPLWQLLGVLGMILAPLVVDHAIAWAACAFGLVIAGGVGSAWIHDQLARWWQA